MMNKILKCIISLAILAILISALFLLVNGSPKKKPVLGKNELSIQTISKDKIMRSTYLLTTSNGATVLFDPYKMPSDNKFVFDPDVITVSHYHFDHYDKAYVVEHGNIKSISNITTLSYKDVNLTSIGSNHGGFFRFGDPNKIKNPPNNVIYVVEADGLKIVHMGDTGQSELSEEQMNILKDADILFTKLNNVIITFGCKTDKRVFRQISQIKPKVIIPTHTTKKCAVEFSEQFGKLEFVDDYWKVDFNDSPKIVYIRNNLKYN